MAKKVVDADILHAKIQSLTYRNWCGVGYYSGSGYNNNNVEDAMRAAAAQINSQIAANVNDAIRHVLMELQNAIVEASFDETAGLCGLCRPMDGECLPPDFRPVNR